MRLQLFLQICEKRRPDFELVPIMLCLHKKRHRVFLLLRILQGENLIRAKSAYVVKGGGKIVDGLGGLGFLIGIRGGRNVQSPPVG